MEHAAGPVSLPAIAAELTRLAARCAPDLVMGIEARGLVLAPMVALGLGVGFSPLRSGDAMFPGPTSRGASEPDYRSRRRELALRTDHLVPGARVVIVDDWIETGSQVSLARDLIGTAGAELVGVVVIVDETSPATRAALPPISSIVRGEDLP
ncbi:phosphoribosyltransferase family protein [Brachybacterium sp. AOP25-B2-12]|uniref:phosphoribosyltransferase family protein n=1 Tax=Brachybacterium sp. AOP25-B2-12 TaxID=3457710 RepID=UPI004034E264